MTNSSKKWNCVACTYLNDGSKTKCDLCLTPRPGTNNNSKKKDDSSKWKCPKCSTKNSATRSACKICGSPSIFLTDYGNKKVCGFCTFINVKNATKCAVCFQDLTSQNDDNNSSKKKKKKKHKKRKYSSDEESSDDSSDEQMKDKHKKDKKKVTGTFVDVKDLYAKDNDKKLVKRQEKECKELLDIYKHVYFVWNKKNNEKLDKDYLMKSFDLVFAKYVEAPEDIKKKPDVKDHYNECQSCYSQFDNTNDETKKIIVNAKCKHSLFCKSCFRYMLSLKIKDEEVTPWLICPVSNCFERINPKQFFEHLSPKELYKFLLLFLRKQLIRNPNFVKCKYWNKYNQKQLQNNKNNKNCKYGFYVSKKNGKKEKKMTCEGCNKKQKVSRSVLNDPGFKELLQKGVLRTCPKCELPTMRDKGMCNIIHCGQCGIYWNWKTRETGNSSTEMKSRARQQGTLWEPGELQYQQYLQKTNLKEFIKLLERNGIKYDPNYRRGGW